LHLGCGNIILDGYTNIDIVPGEGIDVVSDVRSLPMYKDASVDEVYLSHVLEHFSWKQAPEILKEYFRVLKPGGVLRIAVPDMNKIMRLYVEHWDWFQDPAQKVWSGLIYGGHETEYDCHHAGFNFPYLKYLLESAGFVDAKEYVPSEELGHHDASFGGKPFGTVSLNVVARKTGGISTVSSNFRHTFLERILIVLQRIFEILYEACISIRMRLIRKRLYGSWSVKSEIIRIMRKLKKS